MKRQARIALIQGGVTLGTTWLLAWATGFPWAFLAAYLAGLFVIVMYEATQDIAAAIREQSA